MYESTLKVAKNRHGLQKSQRTRELQTLASLGAKTAHPWSVEADLARVWRWRMVAVTHQVRRTTRNV
jgi:hypothetical protein